MRLSKPYIPTQPSARACVRQCWQQRGVQFISDRSKNWLEQDNGNFYVVRRSKALNSYSSIRNWFDLRGLPVTIPSEGRKVGTVEDFYYKVGTNAIYALRVKVGFSGFKALSASAISTIDRNAVTIASQEM